MFIDEMGTERVERDGEWIDVQAVEYGVLQDAQTKKLERLRHTFGDGLAAAATSAVKPKNGSAADASAPTSIEDLPKDQQAAARDPFMSHDAIIVCVAGIKGWSAPADRVKNEANIKKLGEWWLRECTRAIVKLSRMSEVEGKDSPAPSLSL